MNNKNFGFTLVEMMIYLVIFSISAAFLVNILITATKSELSQSSSNEVNNQIFFTANNIQRLVRESSLVENESGVASSSLVLRMASSSLDKTIIYLNATDSIIYIQEGSNEPVPLTNEKVKVTNFSVLKHEIAGSLAVVDIDMTVEYNTTNPQSFFSRRWRGAVSRISAATFDSSVYSTGNNPNLGTDVYPWYNAYFSNNVKISGRLGIGTSSSASARVNSSGDIGFSTSTAGLILMSPDGDCFRLTITNSGNITTSSATCP